jgi:hypothetical protein
MAKFPDYPFAGVVGVKCAGCGQTTIIINRAAYDGTPQYCQTCWELPEAQFTAMHAMEAIPCQPASILPIPL